MKKLKAAPTAALLLALTLLLTTGCVAPEPADQRPTPDATANRMRHLESRLNRLEKDMETVRAQQLEQRAWNGGGISAGLELRVRQLEIRLNSLANDSLPAPSPSPAGITPETATAEQQALVARMAECISQQETNHADEARRNAWRIAAGVTDTGQLRLVADAVCQSDADAR